MSFSYTTFLIIGIETTPQTLGINLWDDQWLPYIEGHPNTNMRIIQSESNPHIYIGKVIASWDRDNEDNYSVTYVPNPEDFVEVDTFVQQTFNWIGESAKLIFFVRVM